MKVKKDKTATETNGKLDNKSKSVKKAKNPVVAVLTEGVEEIEKPVVENEAETIPKKTKKKKAKGANNEDNSTGQGKIKYNRIKSKCQIHILNKVIVEIIRE